MNLRPIRRDPLQFDALELFATYGHQESISIADPTTFDGFLKRLGESIGTSLGHQARLHGFRAQAMFEGLVVGLGRVRFCKQEDAGRAYVADDHIEIPDFRVILDDGSPYLIEVKNYYQTRRKAFAELRLRANYVDGLVRYADIMRCELRLAVYWAAWNSWCLVRPEAFRRQGQDTALGMETAFMANEMAILGDRFVGTRFPLTLRFVVDATKPRSVLPSGRVDFTIGDVHLLCANERIDRDVERKIALFLMLFGDWEQNGWTADIEGGELHSVNFSVRPSRDQGQGFEIVGSLSGMHSSFFRQATGDEQGIRQLRALTEPGSLGSLIPPDYKGEALPLWIFEVRPSARRQPINDQ